MGLEIETATVGYKSSGVNALLDDIKINVIDAAAEALDGALEKLQTEVDDVWKGHSADVFKSNMAVDVGKIKEALNGAHKALESEIDQIVKAMSQIDQELVEKRG